MRQLQRNRSCPAASTPTTQIGTNRAVRFEAAAAVRSDVLHALSFVTVDGILLLARIRRGGFIFVTWVGDHRPRHVHVFREGKLVLKWDLDRRLPMEGVVSRRLLKLLRDLDREGKL